MDWIEVLSPHSKANPLSSDVQVDMDGRGHGFRPRRSQRRCALLCNPSGRGRSLATRQYSASLTRRARNHRRGDGQVGWCHRHDWTGYTVSTTTHLDGLDELSQTTSLISHISLIPAHQPCLTACLLACSPARLNLRSSSSPSSSSVLTPLPTRLLLWSGQNLPPDSTARILASSPIPIHQIPRAWELAPGPRIQPSPPGTSRQGPISNKHLPVPEPGAPVLRHCWRLFLPSASRSVAVIRSVRDQAGPTSRTPSCNDQLPATCSRMVGSSNSHAALIPSVMATPSAGSIPPPKQIRFVNNQGQPPSKRRRVNAASVHPLYTTPSRPSAPLHCVTCAPACETLYHWRDLDCDSGGRVYEKRKSGLLTLIYTPQMFDLPETKDAMRRRETDLHDVRQEWPPVSWISRTE